MLELPDEIMKRSYQSQTPFLFRFDMLRNCIDFDFILHFLSTVSSFGHFFCIFRRNLWMRINEPLACWKAFCLGSGMRASTWLLALELGRDKRPALCLAKLRRAHGDVVRFGCHYCVRFRSQISGDYSFSQCPLDVPSLTYWIRTKMILDRHAQRLIRGR